MKKLLISLLTIGILFSSCKKEPVIEKGTMSLSPRVSEISYGESVTIQPTFSPTGIVNDQKYKWSVSDGNVIEYKTTVIGNNAEVTAKRIGTAWVKYASENGAFKDSVRVTVNARQSFRKIFYTKNANLASILEEEGKIEPDSVKNNRYYYFGRSDTFTQIIYELNNDKLVATYAVTTDNASNQTKLTQYIEERFQETGLASSSVKLYDASVPPGLMYAPNTVIGVFQENSILINGVTLPLGIILRDK